jgi:hypothetical protein
MQFSVDDIHRLRLETAEQHSKMTKDEARRDIKTRAENTKHAIEEIRRLKKATHLGIAE